MTSADHAEVDPAGAPHVPAGPLGMIVAVGPNRVIGRDGTLPWHEPADLAHFRRVTDGHTLIVGRATFDSMPPLPGRRLVVVTSRPDHVDASDQVAVTADPTEAVRVARTTDPFPIVAGGATIYAALFAAVTELWWTEITPDGFVPRPSDRRLPATVDPAGFTTVNTVRLSATATALHLRRR